MKEKVLILASGGLDSTVLIHLYHKLGYDIHLMYIDHNNKNKDQELQMLETIIKNLEIPRDNLIVTKTELPWSKSGTLNGNNSANYYVELRNLVFTSLALSYAEANAIEYVALGLIYSENCPFPDSNLDFLYKMDALARDTIRASVVAPLINASKEDVYNLAKAFGINKWFTCFSPVDNNPCGKCPACNAVSTLYNLPSSVII